LTFRERKQMVGGEYRTHVSPVKYFRSVVIEMCCPTACVNRSPPTVFRRLSRRFRERLCKPRLLKCLFRLAEVLLHGLARGNTLTCADPLVDR
jgi:hypothetical protein